jgi:hypothetical protein
MNKGLQEDFPKAEMFSASGASRSEFLFNL